MDPADRALARLRDPHDPALAELARLIVEQTTATPLQDIAKPRWIAGQIATALEAASGEAAQAWIKERIGAERQRWSTEERGLREFFPTELEEPLRDLLSRPWTPDEDMVFKLIDQAVVQDLVKEILTDGITRFYKRLRSVEKNVLGGLGSRAAKSAVRRSRGLLGNVVPAASDLMGVMAEEFEAAMEGRVDEFVARSTRDQVRRIARHVSNPDHAEAYGELRVSILDIVLDTPISRLTEEADKLDPEELVELVRRTVRGLLEDEAFVEQATQRVEALLAEAGDGTLGAWLAEVGLEDVWTQTTTELVTGRLRAVVEQDEFTAWWADLFESGDE